MFNTLCKSVISRVFASEESLPANTRLFLWVEQKTQAEKSHDTENL